MSAATRPAPWNGLRSRRLRIAGPWLPLEAAAVAAVLATLAVPLVPPFEFAYNAPSLRVALDTGVAVIGLLATAIVVRGRRRRSLARWGRYATQTRQSRGVWRLDGV